MKCMYSIITTIHKYILKGITHVQRLTTLVFILLCVFCSVSHSQIVDSLTNRKVSSFEGSHFLVSYMQNENFIQSSGIRLRLMIASALPANVRISVPGISPTSYFIEPNTVLNLTIPITMEVRESERILQRAVEISSDAPVSVYAMSSQYTSSDSYAVIPTTNWGSNYTVLSMPNDTYNVGITDSVPPQEIRQSEFMIIAAFDNTIVNFLTKAPTEKGKPANTWHRITLNKGDCYLVKSAPTKPQLGDLTGSQVQANRPIAVLSGHVRTSVPQPMLVTTDSKDHLAEWLIPDQALSTEYISVPFKTPSRLPFGDYIRVVATQPNTDVFVRTERQDLRYTLINTGDIINIPNVESPAWFTSDKPISVGQYMYTGSAGSSSDYDPAMVIVPPCDKYIGRTLFQTPANQNDPAFASQFQTHFVNIICDEKAMESIKLDGIRVVEFIAPELRKQKFRSSAYFWAQIKLAPGKHELEADSGLFSGTLYGMGYTDSYAHTLGFSTLPPSRDTIAPSVVTSMDCGAITGEVREFQDPVSTALAFVYADADSTKNYDITIGDVRDDPNNVKFSAKPKDMYKDAQLFLLTRDRAGNGRRVRYYYRSPQFDISEAVRFTAQTETDSICRTIFVSSVATMRDSFFIRSARLAQNSGSIKLFNQVPYPIQVGPRNIVYFNLCFNPNQGGLFLHDTIIFSLDCGLSLKIPITATSPTSSIAVSDIEFDSVFVGNDSCKTLVLKNNGTRTATIQSLQLDSASSHYSIDPIPSFPVTLKSGDSMTVRVCFSPKDTGIFRRIISFRNSLNLPVSGRLSGVGVRPILQALDLDFGKQRTGTNTDMSIRIVNSGNASALINYINPGKPQTIFKHSLGNLRQTRIAAKDTFKFPVRFNPQSEIQYFDTLRFTSTSKETPLLEVRLTGEGTKPIIETSDVWFDTILVNTTKQLLAVIKSSGNEQLTIDTITIEGVSKASFTISNTLLGYRVIPQGGSLVIPIVFTPKIKGEHQISLSVKHDANPLYFRTNSIIDIRGWAKDSTGSGNPIDTTKKVLDTISATMSISGNLSPTVCSEQSITTSISNKGKQKLFIRSAIINSIGGGFSTTQIYPAIINTNQSLSISSLIPSPQIGRKYYATAVVRDTSGGRVRDSIIFSDTIEIVPRKGTGTIQMINARVSPDSITTLKFSGVFNDSLLGTLPSEIEVGVPRAYLDAKEIVGELLVNDNLGQRKIPVLLRYKSSNGLTIELSDKAVPIRSPNTNWSIDIRFLGLLNTPGAKDVMLSIQESTCWNAISNRGAIVAQGGCASDIRMVDFVGFSVLQLRPSPADDHTQIDIISYSESTLKAELINNLGQKITLAENYLLPKGYYTCIFATDHIPSGNYILTVESGDGQRTFIPLLISR
jgi:hypothetical protein